MFVLLLQINESLDFIVFTQTAYKSEYCSYHKQENLEQEQARTRVLIHVLIGS